MRFLKAIFFIVCEAKSEMLSNKSGVWCSRDIPLMLGGLVGHHQELFEN